MPGPLAEQILGVFRQEQQPLLVLRDPVSVRIVGRKIYQEGLVIPLGNVAAIGIEGWVDFDQNLNLVASFAMVPPRRNIPVLSDILENAQIQLPITGTFKKPKTRRRSHQGPIQGPWCEHAGQCDRSGGQRPGSHLAGRARAVPPPRRDFFPPFVTPDNEQTAPPPPAPGSAGSSFACACTSTCPRAPRLPCPGQPPAQQPVPTNPMMSSTSPVCSSGLR